MACRTSLRLRCVGCRNERVAAEQSVQCIHRADGVLAGGGYVVAVLLVHKDQFAQVMGVAETMEAVVAEIRLPEVADAWGPFKSNFCILSRSG